MYMHAILEIDEPRHAAIPRASLPLMDPARAGALQQSQSGLTGADNLATARPGGPRATHDRSVEAVFAPLLFREWADRRRGVLWPL